MLGVGLAPSNDPMRTRHSNMPATSRDWLGFMHARERIEARRLVTLAARRVRRGRDANICRALDVQVNSFFAADVSGRLKREARRRLDGCESVGDWLRLRGLDARCHPEMKPGLDRAHLQRVAIRSHGPTTRRLAFPQPWSSIGRLGTDPPLMQAMISPV